MEKTTLVLKTPVKSADGTTYTELTLRELTVGENVSLQKQHGEKIVLEQDVHFFAMMCGVPSEVITAMKQRDWVRLKNLYFDTLGNVDPESESSDSESRTSA